MDTSHSGSHSPRTEGQGLKRKNTFTSEGLKRKSIYTSESNLLIRSLSERSKKAAFADSSEVFVRLMRSRTSRRKSQKRQRRRIDPLVNDDRNGAAEDSSRNCGELLSANEHSETVNLSNSPGSCSVAAENSSRNCGELLSATDHSETMNLSNSPVSSSISQWREHTGCFDASHDCPLVAEDSAPYGVSADAPATKDGTPDTLRPDAPAAEDGTPGKIRPDAAAVVTAGASLELCVEREAGSQTFASSIGCDSRAYPAQEEEISVEMRKGPRLSSQGSSKSAKTKAIFRRPDHQRRKLAGSKVHVRPVVLQTLKSFSAHIEPAPGPQTDRLRGPSRVPRTVLHRDLLPGLGTDLHRELSPAPQRELYGDVSAVSQTDLHRDLSPVLPTDLHSDLSTASLTNLHRDLSPVLPTDLHNDLSKTSLTNLHRDLTRVLQTDLHKNVSPVPQTDLHSELFPTPQTDLHRDVSPTPQTDIHRDLSPVFRTDLHNDLSTTSLTHLHRDLSPVLRTDLHSDLSTTSLTSLHRDLTRVLQTDLHRNVSPVPWTDLRRELLPTPQTDLHRDVSPTLQTDLLRDLSPVLRADLHSDMSTASLTNLHRDMSPVLRTDLHSDLSTASLTNLHRDLSPILRTDLHRLDLSPVLRTDLHGDLSPVLRTDLHSKDLSPVLPTDLHSDLSTASLTSRHRDLSDVLQRDRHSRDLSPVLRTDHHRDLCTASLTNLHRDLSHINQVDLHRDMSHILQTDFHSRDLSPSPEDKLYVDMNMSRKQTRSNGKDRKTGVSPSRRPKKFQCPPASTQILKAGDVSNVSAGRESRLSSRRQVDSAAGASTLLLGEEGGERTQECFSSSSLRPSGQRVGETESLREKSSASKDLRDCRGAELTFTSESASGDCMRCDGLCSHELSTHSPLSPDPFVGGFGVQEYEAMSCQEVVTPDGGFGVSSCSERRKDIRSIPREQLTQMGLDKILPFRVLSNSENVAGLEKGDPADAEVGRIFESSPVKKETVPLPNSSSASCPAAALSCPPISAPRSRDDLPSTPDPPQLKSPPHACTSPPTHHSPKAGSPARLTHQLDTALKKLSANATAREGDSTVSITHQLDTTLKKPSANATVREGDSAVSITHQLDTKTNRPAKVTSLKKWRASAVRKWESVKAAGEWKPWDVGKPTTAISDWETVRRTSCCRKWELRALTRGSFLSQLRVNQDDLEAEMTLRIQEEEEETQRQLLQQTTPAPSQSNKTQLRANVVNEIITAEAEYVKHLRDVIEVSGVCVCVCVCVWGGGGGGHCVGGWVGCHYLCVCVCVCVCVWLCVCDCV